MGNQSAACLGGGQALRTVKPCVENLIFKVFLPPSRPSEYGQYLCCELYGSVLHWCDVSLGLFIQSDIVDGQIIKNGLNFREL